MTTYHTFICTMYRSVTPFSINLCSLKKKPKICRHRHLKMFNDLISVHSFSTLYRHKLSENFSLYMDIYITYIFKCSWGVISINSITFCHFVKQIIFWADGRIMQAINASTNRPLLTEEFTQGFKYIASLVQRRPVIGDISYSTFLNRLWEFDINWF